MKTSATSNTNDFQHVVNLLKKHDLLDDYYVSGILDSENNLKIDIFK